MTTSANPDHFFQTTHSISETSRRAAKSRNNLGRPIRLPSKILAVIADPTTYSSSPVIYVAESAGTARRVSLDVGTLTLLFALLLPNQRKTKDLKLMGNTLGGKHPTHLHRTYGSIDVSNTKP